MPAKIAASLMCADFRHLEADIRSLESAGVDYLHIDVMDGHFVPNLAMGPHILRTVRQLTSIPVDIHFMVEAPERFLDMFEIGEDDVVSVHQESTVHIHRVLSVIRDLGARPAVAINPATPICMVEDVLGDVDMVLVMTVDPGFAGQNLVEATVPKIASLRRLLGSCELGDVEIEVDGNVSFENAPRMLEAGATVFVGGTSSVFARGLTIVETTEQLRRLLAK